MEDSLKAAKRKVNRGITFKNYKVRENEVIITLIGKKPYLIDNRIEGNLIKQYYVDKNMRIVIPDKYNNFFPKSYPRLPSYFARYLRRDQVAPVDGRFIVINQDKFLESKGKEFIISYKKYFEYNDILAIKKYYISTFNLIKTTCERIKDIIGSVYDEDHYDILFYDDLHGNLNFMIIVKHDNLTLTNSIEQSKFIGTLFTHFYGVVINEGRIYMNVFMTGTRSTYNYKDIMSDYVHSHLPPDSSRNFNTFCLGSGNDIFSGIRDNHRGYNMTSYYEANELELEGIMLALQEYVKWESLEGGPHKKIESVNLLGHSIDSFNDSSTLIRSQDYLTNQLREQLTNFLLEPQNLEELKSSFILIKKGNNYKFIYDVKSLVIKIILLTNKHTHIKKLYQGFGYDSSTNKIVQLNFNTGLETCKRSIKKREAFLLNSYINGKIIVPEINLEESEKEALNKILTCTHPSEYMKIANTIVRLLNQELLKDEYRKK